MNTPVSPLVRNGTQAKSSSYTIAVRFQACTAMLSIFFRNTKENVTSYSAFAPLHSYFFHVFLFCLFLLLSLPTHVQLHLRGLLATAGVLYNYILNELSF